MPLPAAVAAAYASLASALPSLAPVLGVAAVGFGIVATHQPEAAEPLLLVGNPETAAECVKSNVTAVNPRLAAVAQPLYGTEKIGVVVKTGIVGEALVSVVLEATETGTGSRVNVRPLGAPDEHRDLLAKLIAGC